MKKSAYTFDAIGSRESSTVAGTVTLHQRYIYREYLQIACVDLTRAAHPALWFVLWDPTRPTATRPLAIQKDGSWFTYGHDVTKNVWEVFGPSGYIRTSYDYAPFGAVSATGDVTQPFQWSSEFYDSELGLVYYNYRHYSPTDGRWLSRDPIGEQGGRNLYCFVGNNSVSNEEFLGLKRNLPCCGGKEYNPKIKCCINEKLVSRQGTATIVLKLGHNYSARDDFRKKRPGAKEKWGYVCCTGKSVNDEFISLPASGIPDHKNCRTDCFIYPQGDDVETKSVETAYQEELENATIEAKASCEQDCVKSVRISVRSLDKYGKEWMENRKPILANGGVVKIVSCTRG